MPRKPRKLKKINERLTGLQVCHLLRGYSLAVYPGADIHMPFKDDEHRRELYFQNRNYLFSLEGVEKIPGVFGGGLKIGEKPAAYYDYEATPEEKEKHESEVI